MFEELKSGQKVIIKKMIHSKNANTPEKSYKNFFKIFPLQTEKDIHSLEQKLIDETYYEQIVSIMHVFS